MKLSQQKENLIKEYVQHSLNHTNLELEVRILPSFYSSISRDDFTNVIKRLKIGGILVFDDISSHEHPYLNGVWEKVIKSRKNFYTWEFRDVGLGVAFAIRKY